jgi:hypothetical protein
MSVRWVAVLGLVVLGCAAARTVVPYPSARVLDLELESVDLSALLLRFEVEVENPYSVALPLVGADFTLSSAGARILEGNTALERSIPARGTGRVPIPVRVPWAELIRAVGTVRPGGEVPLEAEVGLTMDAPVLGAVRLPLTHADTLAVPSVQ